jgi:hypothetical protein
MDLMNPVHSLIPFFFKINFNIILLFKFASSMLSPLSWFTVFFPDDEIFVYCIVFTAFYNTAVNKYELHKMFLI